MLLTVFDATTNSTPSDIPPKKPNGPNPKPGVDPGASSPPPWPWWGRAEAGLSQSIDARREGRKGGDGWEGREEERITERMQSLTNGRVLFLDKAIERELVAHVINQIII